MSEWKEVRLGEIADFKTGRLDSNAAVENGKYPFFTCSPQTLAIDDFAFDQKAILLAGNNAEGNFSIKYFEGKFNAYQRTYVISAKQETELLFLFYALKLCLAQFKTLSQGTATKFLTKVILDNFLVPLPPLPVQQRIAEILGSLDEKIELNRRTSATLEQMAQALFRCWFVDFDPVKAKAAGKRPKNLAPEIARLFPKEFEDSTLGPIPKGWTVYPFFEVFEINPYRSLAKTAEATYLDMSNMPTQTPIPLEWSLREFGSGMKFTNGDTLIARITPCLENGKTAYINFLRDGETAWGSTEYIVLRPKKNIPLPFAYLLVKSNEFRSFAIQQMTGSSGRQRVPVYFFDLYFVSLPSIDSTIFPAFGCIIDPLFVQMKQFADQIRTLSQIRDALLPKLLSGKVML